MRRYKQVIGLVAAVTAVLLFVYLCDPAYSVWAPKCPVYLLTGWQCGACGIQRALYELMHGHVAAAYAYNPFLMISLPYAGLLLVAQVLPARQRERWCRVLHDNRVVYGFLALFLCWSVYRNL